MDRSNQNSKKRKLGELSNANKEDEELLFGNRNNAGGDENYRGGAGDYDDDVEAMEDDAAIIEDDDA